MSDVQPLIGRVVSRADVQAAAELQGRPAMPRDVERATTRAVATSYARAVVGTARVRAVDRVTSEAMHCLADLERQEAAAVASDPMNAGRRQRALVDAASKAMLQAVTDAAGGW